MHDDGKHMEGLGHADVVLVGPSRCGKTPLSVYLALEGWRVGNVPLVHQQPVPRELTRLPKGKIIGLVVDPRRLAEIRRARLEFIAPGSRMTYDDEESIREELAWYRRICGRHGFRMVDVTQKAIEESATRCCRSCGATAPRTRRRRSRHAARPSARASAPSSASVTGDARPASRGRRPFSGAALEECRTRIRSRSSICRRACSWTVRAESEHGSGAIASHPALRLAHDGTTPPRHDAGLDMERGRPSPRSDPHPASASSCLRAVVFQAIAAAVHERPNRAPPSTRSARTPWRCAESVELGFAPGGATVSPRWPRALVNDPG